MERDEKLKTVFIMWHIRKDDEFADNAKLIGIYRTRADCEAAIQRLKAMPGFRDHVAGFHIGEYPLNKDHRAEGFINHEEAVGVGRQGLESLTNSD